MVIYKEVMDFADALEALAAFNVWTETLLNVVEDFLFELDLNEDLSEKLYAKFYDYIQGGCADRSMLCIDI